VGIAGSRDSALGARLARRMLRWRQAEIGPDRAGSEPRPVPDFDGEGVGGQGRDAPEAGQACHGRSEGRGGRGFGDEAVEFLAALFERMDGFIGVIERG